MVKFIINPHAGKGQTLKIWDKVQSALAPHGIKYDYSITGNTDEAKTIVTQAIKNGFNSLCIVGGDGTVNGVVNCIVNKGVALGIIPTGSGNDFSKMLGITSVEAGISSLFSGRRRKIDLGRVGDHYFVNILGLGFDALVAFLFKKGRLKGNFGYLAAVLTALSGYRPPWFSIKSENFFFAGRVLSVSVGNGIFHGGMFRMTPEAVIDDGLLDICVTEKLPTAKFLYSIPKAVKGTHISLREITMFKAKTLSVESDTPFFAHWDGEVMQKPVEKLELTIIPKALEVITL